MISEKLSHHGKVLFSLKAGIHKFVDNLVSTSHLLRYVLKYRQGHVLELISCEIRMLRKYLHGLLLRIGTSVYRADASDKRLRAPAEVDVQP